MYELTVTSLFNVGTWKVRNEIETKRNETKTNETKSNETKCYRSKRNETKSNETKRNDVTFRFVSFLFRFALYMYPLLTVGLVKMKSYHIKNCLPWIFIPRHVSLIFSLQTVTTFEPIIWSHWNSNLICILWYQNNSTKFEIRSQVISGNH